jgi:hypothetical protein
MRRAWDTCLIITGIALASACAATTSTCPTGTKLVTSTQRERRAEWCSATSTPISELPVTGRTYEATLGLEPPTAMPHGVEGPFTSWHRNGALASHGRYVTRGGRSVPEGLWAFWYPDGQRLLFGNYHDGSPVGCFAHWDEHGAQTTGILNGTELHVAPCTPPPDGEMLVLEGRARPPELTPPWGDISVQVFAGPNRLGTSNPDQNTPEPAMTVAFSATARKRLGRLRVGPTFGLRIANQSEGYALLAGASIGWALPTFHPRIDAEVAADVDVEQIEVTAMRATERGTASVTFRSPLVGLQTGVALTLSPAVAAIATARIEGFPRREADRDVIYCDFGCTSEIHETWQVGGFGWGVNVGLRLLIR